MTENEVPKICSECGATLDEEGDCPDNLCPASPWYDEEEEDEDSLWDEDLDDTQDQLEQEPGKED